MSDGCGHDYGCGTCPGQLVCDAAGACVNPVVVDPDPTPGPCELAPPSAGQCATAGFVLWHQCPQDPGSVETGGCLALEGVPGAWCCPG